MKNISLSTAFFVSLVLALILARQVPTQAEIRLPSIVGSGMVLQQNEEVTLWGWASPGKKVSVRPSWGKGKYVTTAGQDGAWEVNVRTVGAGGPYSITISDGTPVILEDILLGEVWFCGGQSNMEMPLGGFMNQPVEGGAEAVTTASAYPQIRLFTVGKNSKTELQTDCPGRWQRSCPESAADFSAVGWYFGKILTEALGGVPVGLISSNWGGSRIEAWMTKEKIRSIGGINQDIAMSGTDSNQIPQALFGGMVWPVHKFTLKGFLWYQGCSNTHNWFDYDRLMVALVEEWREIWGDADLPFYYVQIAPFRETGPDRLDFPMVVEAQMKALAAIPHSAMVGTTDLGERDCVHIRRKFDVAQRLAWLALANDYGVKGLPRPAPTFSRFEYDGPEQHKIALHFDHLCAEKTWMDPDSFDIFADGHRISPGGFEVAGEDRIWHPAEAYFWKESNIITVWSDEVQHPVAVRYAFHNYCPEANIVTTYGQPLMPFRTDDWPVTDLRCPEPQK